MTNDMLDFYTGVQRQMSLAESHQRGVIPKREGLIVKPLLIRIISPA